MVVRRADNVALRGASVYHDLLPVPFLFEYVEYLREHLHSGADRYGYHSDVAPADALLERDDLVHKFHPFGRGGVHRVSLHPKNYPGESSSLQVMAIEPPIRPNPIIPTIIKYSLLLFLFFCSRAQAPPAWRKAKSGCSHYHSFRI